MESGAKIAAPYSVICKRSSGYHNPFRRVRNWTIILSDNRPANGAPTFMAKNALEGATQDEQISFLPMSPKPLGMKQQPRRASFLML